MRGLTLGVGFNPPRTTPVFTPSSLSSLAVWYDAADTSTIVQTAGSVSQWNDKSGHAYNATQTTASAQPTTGASTINGKNVLSFNGTTWYLNTPDIGFLLNGDSTEFYVIQASATGGYPFSDVGGGVGRRYGLTLSSPDIKVAAGSSYSVISGAYTTSPILVSGVKQSLSLTSYSGATVGSTVASLNQLGGAAYVGQFNGTSGYYQGTIAEIVLYNRALSNTEMNRVGRYLSGKWGVTWTNL